MGIASKLSLPARPFTYVAHVLGLAAAVMVLVWCIHFRGGLAFESTDKSLIFNTHPVLMLIGFIILGSEAIMSYKSLPFAKIVKKVIHLILHGLALLFGVIGIYAAFKFHNESGFPNLYSFHSWVGLGTYVYMESRYVWAERFQAHEAIKRMIPKPDKLFEALDEKITVGSEQKEEIDQAYICANQLAFNSALSMTMKVVIELGVFDVIANAGIQKFLSTKEIANELSMVNPDAPIMLNRMLRLLASHNILICKMKSDGEADEVTTTVSTTLYGLGPISKYFVKNDDGVSIGPLLVLLHDENYMKSWYYMKDAVMTGGIPFNMAYGMSAFEYHAIDTRFNKLFNHAFFNITILMKRILHSYNGFEGVNKLVDVGGGIGANLDIIVSKHPTIKGVNFDLPHVIKDAPLIKGVEHVSGDMFEKIPCGDAIFVKILKNCWKQLPKNGRVIICETVLPDEPQENNLAIYSDVVMMALNPGGKERTESEYGLLATKAGFVDFKVACDVEKMYIMELTK